MWKFVQKGLNLNYQYFKKMKNKFELPVSKFSVYTAEDSIRSRRQLSILVHLDFIQRLKSQELYLHKTRKFVTRKQPGSTNMSNVNTLIWFNIKSNTISMKLTSFLVTTLFLARLELLRLTYYLSNPRTSISQKSQIPLECLQRACSWIVFYKNKNWFF